MPNIEIDWLADHVQVPKNATLAELAADLVKVGIEEEEIKPPAVQGRLVVGKVLDMQAEPQKNGKTINWCQVEVGENEPRGIVCGAHNFITGVIVVVALDGTVLPGGFEIAARKTYGHISNGMICSEAELGLSTESEGILVLTDCDYVDNASDLKPGDDAAALLGLNIGTLEINITPDRGYCFSYRGIAREYSHSTGAVFADPVIKLRESASEHSETSSSMPLLGTNTHSKSSKVKQAKPSDALQAKHPNVVIKDKNACSRFVSRIVTGINPKAKSPLWMQQRLTRAGMRSISLSVDVTNYVMLDLGQPLHAYDLDELQLPITVRFAKEGEQLTTLDGATHTLSSDDIAITDNRAEPIGLAGVMGGESTEVTDKTVSIFIEAAHFNAKHIFRTARRHGYNSEASFRFERGVDTDLQVAAAEMAVQLLVKYGGGTDSDVAFDVNYTTPPVPIDFPVSEVKRLLGVEISRDEIVKILQETGCAVAENKNYPAKDEFLLVTPPTWRPDITIKADLVEEVGRLHGYDAIPSTLPAVNPDLGARISSLQQAKRKVANMLAEQGLAETQSYPFIGKDTFPLLYGADFAELPKNLTFLLEIYNPLAKDKPYLRTSLLQTLLRTAELNVKRNNERVNIFEIGRVTLPNVYTNSSHKKLPGAMRPSDSELAEITKGLPNQPFMVSAVITDCANSDHDQFTRAIAFANKTFQTASANAKIIKTDDYPMFHPGKQAAFITDEGETLGIAGELKPQLAQKLKLPKGSAAFELNLDAIVSSRGEAQPVHEQAISLFPSVQEDYAFVVDKEFPALKLQQIIQSAVPDLLQEIEVFDIYAGENVPADKKSIAFRLKFRATDRTLDAKTLAEMRKAIISAVEERADGVLR
jgi:phenylalanyl-tRNA synthetase beta chain